MIEMPDYEIEEVPLKLVGGRIIDFAEKGDDIAAYANFCLKIRATEDGSDWEINEVWMGERRLNREAFCWAANHLEVEKSDEIWDHVNKHLNDIKDAAKFHMEDLER